MADMMTPEQRSRCMAAVKGKNTKPEMMVRKYLFSKGLRYRVNNRKLPGSPDIVLKKYKTAVFIDGCFWHGHEGCRYYRMPKSNVDFWERKISHNKARDISNNAVLGIMGWKVIRVWECDVKTKESREQTLLDLYHKITGGSPDSLQPGKKADVRYGDSGSLDIAAEPESPY